MKISTSAIGESETVTSNWQWQHWEGMPYLTCNLLQEWQHGFFTQQFYPRSPETLVKILHPNAKVYRVQQVHGNKVLLPTEIEAAMSEEDSNTNLPPADGIVTDGKQQAVWVAGADCTPVLIGDVISGKVGAVHAGWRGTAQKIVPEAIGHFLSSGSSLDNLRIAMGPAINGKIYQVSEFVAAEIGASIVSVDRKEAVLEAMWELADSPLLEDSQPGRVRLDVRRVNEIQIEQLGIGKQQISIAPFCTYQQEEYFFSYRRTNQKKVQWSGIVSK